MTDAEQTAVRAADLAEWIVDEIGRDGQDWRAIGLRARELAELVAPLGESRSAQRAPSMRCADLTARELQPAQAAAASGRGDRPAQTLHAA
jgi:hypothetical protein